MNTEEERIRKWRVQFAKDMAVVSRSREARRARIKKENKMCMLLVSIPIALLVLVIIIGEWLSSR